MQWVHAVRALSVRDRSVVGAWGERDRGSACPPPPKLREGGGLAA